MAPRKSKRPATSPYPVIPYWIAKAFQSLSACTVAGVMFTFIAHLNDHNFTVPWMFFFLQGAALLTLITGILFSLWSCFRPGSISPIIFACASGTLFILWSVGFGLLANNMASTLTRPCTLVYWGTDQGVLVCTLYKVLFAGASVGVLSTLACLWLDISASRRMSRMKAKSSEDETLLAKGVGNSQYMPVWADETTSYPPVSQGTTAVRTGSPAL